MRSSSVKIQKLKACCFELIDENRRDPREQLIAQVVVGFALAAQASAIDADRKRLLDRAALKARPVGRDQPGPAQNLAFTEGLNRDDPPRWGVGSMATWPLRIR